MGLFSRNFDRPGPGVQKDEPRKKGAARFFELLFRDFVDYIKLSLLFTAAALPSAAAFVWGAFPYLVGEPEFGISLLPLMLSLILAYPIGGVLVACFYNITRHMRDDPSFLWHDFKRKFKENHKQAAMMGIICAAFTYMQVLLWFLVYYQLVDETYTGGLVWLILAAMSLLLFLMITPYIFMHYAYIDLRTSQIVKNSLLMTFAYLPRSFMGGVFGGIIWVLFALFMPSSLMVLPFVPLIFIALAMLMALSWVWPPFEKFHGIEEALKKRREEKEDYSP